MMLPNFLLSEKIVESIRSTLDRIDPSPRVEPNEYIELDQVFMPDSHRAVLDPGRQIVVGNRGTGKSFWTHALGNPEVKSRAALRYNQPILDKTKVVIGFNGSAQSLSSVAPARFELDALLRSGVHPDLIWRTVIYRAIKHLQGAQEPDRFERSLNFIVENNYAYAETLTSVDRELARDRRTFLVMFDALDRLAEGWDGIRELTKSLLKAALDLRSFRSFRMKIFMRPDQFADRSLFAFPDASKLRNDHVDLSWTTSDLYGLLFFEIMRDVDARGYLQNLAFDFGLQGALPSNEQRRRVPANAEQEEIIAALAGRYMGADHRKGRVYTWVPLHLSDAHGTCSPRSFLTAWRAASLVADNVRGKVVNHLGLIDGVRQASSVRLEELLEDYGWMSIPLDALKGRLVPMEYGELVTAWTQANVPDAVVRWAGREQRVAPLDLGDENGGINNLLSSLETIAVMEVRANGKINVPDIFRVQAGIKRKGGVTVPKRGGSQIPDVYKD